VTRNYSLIFGASVLAITLSFAPSVLAQTDAPADTERGATLTDKTNDLAITAKVQAGKIIQQFHPVDVFLIRTDQWFDTKWLGFSGKMLGALGVTKRRLTLPPFVPNRVLSQATYSLVNEMVFYQERQVSPLHLIQPSRNNLTRFIDLITKSGVFVWFSGDTQQNANGSLMIYTVANNSQSGWYASFQNANLWKINKVRGLSKNELLYLMSEAVA